MISRDKMYSKLAQIVSIDFGDIVEGATIVEGKLRILLRDESFIDIWLSTKKKGVYAYHWERRNIDGTIYRFLKTFFHFFSEQSLLTKKFIRM